MGFFDPLKKAFNALTGPTPGIPIVPKPTVNFSMDTATKNAIFAPKPTSTPTIGPVLPKIEPSPVAPSGNNYTVMSGDTLSGIASKNKTSLNEILNLNPQYRANPNLIKPGESISLKGAPKLPNLNENASININAKTGGSKPASLTKVKTGSIGADGQPIYDVFSGTEHIQDPNDQRLSGINITDLPEGTNPQGFQSKFTPPIPDLPKSGSEGSNIVIPPVPPVKSAYDIAAENYQAAIPMTPEEEATQTQIDNLLSSTRLGVAGKEGQGRGIPLELVRGQQAQLEKQGLLLSQPLIAKAALLQAKRTAAIDASKFAMEQEKTKISDAKEASKPVSVSQGSSLVDPSTGKVIYKAPAAEQSIAEKYGSGAIGEYNFYAEQEKNSGRKPKTLEEYRSIGESTTGMPNSYKEWTLAGGLDGTGKTYAQWAGPKETIGTQAQQTVAEYAARIEQAEPTINTLQEEIQKMNLISFEAQIKLPSALQSTEIQQYMQAARNFINAKLRRESGAVIAESEFTEAKQQYLPQPGDSPENLQLKKNNRDLIYASLKRAAGPAFSSVNELLNGVSEGATDEGFTW